MVQNASNDINWFLVVDTVDKELLAGIRHWANLKMAFEEKAIWVKDFSLVQINSLEVKSIPFKKIYYSANGKLCFKDSLLPERNIPALLWTPLERGLPITLPSFNHNFFEISEKLSVKLVYSGVETECHVMQTSVSILRDYIVSAPSVRLQKLQWTMIDDDTVMLFGTPLLPIQGEPFYRKKDFLIPAGYDLELYSLQDALNDVINPDGNNWVLWNKNGGYITINKWQLTPLSLSSFRLSFPKTSAI